MNFQNGSCFLHLVLWIIISPQLLNLPYEEGEREHLSFHEHDPAGFVYVVITFEVVFQLDLQSFSTFQCEEVGVSTGRMCQSSCFTLPPASDYTAETSPGSDIFPRNWEGLCPLLRIPATSRLDCLEMGG